MLNGFSPVAGAILGMLKLGPDSFGRFRDAFLRDDEEGGGLRAVVLTRCGGDNKEEYKDIIDSLIKHKLFIKTYDDNFDNTYCYFEFNIDENQLDEVKNTVKLASEMGARDLIVRNYNMKEATDRSISALADAMASDRIQKDKNLN